MCCGRVGPYLLPGDSLKCFEASVEEAGEGRMLPWVPQNLSTGAESDVNAKGGGRHGGILGC